jgi:putative nucleotidyltransferase with HDIG domain
MIRARDIERLFAGQLAGIKEEKLRRQVVDTWLLGCQEGGWTSVEELRKMPFTLLTDTKGVSFIEHTIAVTEGALALVKAQTDNYGRMPYEVNLDRLIAGGLLHDVGKLVEVEPDPKGGYRTSLSGKCARHPVSGSMLAARAGLPVEVINVIACHAREGEGRPQVLETIFIHQADFATFDPLVMMNKGQVIR